MQNPWQGAFNNSRPLLQGNHFDTFRPGMPQKHSALPNIHNAFKSNQQHCFRNQHASTAQNNTPVPGNVHNGDAYEGPIEVCVWESPVDIQARISRPRKTTFNRFEHDDPPEDNIGMIPRKRLSGAQKKKLKRARKLAAQDNQDDDDDDDYDDIDDVVDLTSSPISERSTPSPEGLSTSNPGSSSVSGKMNHNNAGPIIVRNPYGRSHSTPKDSRIMLNPSQIKKPDESSKVGEANTTNSEVGTKEAQWSELTVVICEEAYPEREISEEESKILTSTISQLIYSQGVKAAPLPRFKRTCFVKGVVILDCYDDSSRDWLKQVVTQLKPWNGSALTLSPVQSVFKLKLATLKIPEPLLDSNLFMEHLRKHNPELNTDQWIVHSRKSSENSGHEWIVGVDDTSVETLKTLNMQPFYALGRVTVEFLY